MFNFNVEQYLTTDLFNTEGAFSVRFFLVSFYWNLSRDNRRTTDDDLSAIRHFTKLVLELIEENEDEEADNYIHILMLGFGIRLEQELREFDETESQTTNDETEDENENIPGEGEIYFQDDGIYGLNMEL